MKSVLMKFLLLSIILTKLSYVGSSQTTDTICLPVADAKKVLADAKAKPVLQERIVLLTDDIRLLNQRIAVKDSIIATYTTKDGNNQAIIKALEDQKGIMEEQRKLFEDQVKGYEKLLRREKRKRFWTAVGGTITTGAALYLFISK